MAAAAMDDPPDSLAATSSPLAEDATATIIAASFDPTMLTDYLADLAVVALNASRDDLRLSLLSYPDTLQKCSRFAADPNSLVLYLRKETGETGSQIGTFGPFFENSVMLTFRGWQNALCVLPWCGIFCWPCNSRVHCHNKTSSAPRLEHSSPESTPVCPPSWTSSAYRARDSVTV
jgi:hypothetical protein